MMSRRIFFSIVLLFVILFVLFMFSALSSNMLSKPEINDRGGEVSAIDSESAFLDTAFAPRDTVADTEASQSGEAVPDAEAQPEAAVADQAAHVTENPLAVLIAGADDGMPVLREWCLYNKYRYRTYTAWPDASALAGASVVLVGEMPYDAATLPVLTAYAKTGIPLLFTSLPDFDTLAASPELMDFFGILQCVEPACRVDGLKLFADFFLSKERIYQEGDFYGRRMTRSLPLRTIRFVPVTKGIWSGC